MRFLRPALLAFQSLEQNERTALNESLTVLQKDEDIRTQNNEIKYKYFFFDLLTTCGEQTFNSIYADLLEHLQRVQAAAPPTPPPTPRPAPGT